ncbi:ATP-grasp domain-containing protein [Streptomyces sp. Z26]|uniref:carboxylate--amine ligase n=1 Tax=Streptomyces sp. Z26 TaxID=2500177 RepID=UPI0019D2E489|nr:ATP-grasp domain-containing protein [Streptomyces sp. Z26]
MARTRTPSPARPSAPPVPAPPAPAPPALDTAVPALLLRLDPNPFHHGTLGAVRSLGRAGVEVHAFVESARDPAGHSRHLRRAYAMPRGAVTAERLATVLRRTARLIGRPAVLVPMDDLSAVLAPRAAARAGGRFLLPDLPDLPDLPGGLAERVADKEALAALCRLLDIPHPRTVVPGDAAEAAAATRALGPPVVAKWSRPWLLPGAASGLRSTTLVRDPDEARRLFARGREAGSRLLLQARVPGGRDADWFFHGCRTADGWLGGGAGRKDLAWPTGAGLTAVGSRLPNPAVEETADRLAAHLGYRGILDLDFRFDPGTGTYHLLDFNPRPGAQFRIFADDGPGGTGLDVVRALHLDLTGRAATARAAAEPRGARVFVAENYALLSALSAPLDLARAVRGPAGMRTRREGAWFAGDDPAPFAAMAWAWGGHGVRKGLRRLARRHRTDGAPAVPRATPQTAPTAPTATTKDGNQPCSTC